MPSSIDATKPLDGVPAGKADLRNNLAVAKTELEHGGFAEGHIPVNYGPSATSRVVDHLGAIDEALGGVSGGAFTFTGLNDTPPDYTAQANRFVRVRNDESGLEFVDQAAGGDASTTNYTQAGTGAITRTLQDRLRDFISAKDFGAKGDGHTDDTAEIQAAIDYASAVAASSAQGAVLYFPPGAYLINDGLDNPGNVSMVGAGARATRILGGASFPATKLEGGATFDTPMIIVRRSVETSIDISDMHIDGQNNAPSGLHLVQCINISVRNIRTLNHLQDGIVVDALQNSSFMNCRPADSGRYNWHFMNGAKLIELFGCNARDAGVANVAVKAQTNFPGYGLAGGDDQVRCVNWFGHILEGNAFGTKQYVIDLDQARRWSFKGMNLVGQTGTTVVNISSNARGRFLFESCLFNGGGGAVTTPAVVVNGGGKTWIRDCWIENYSSASSLFECSVPDGIFVDRCHIAPSANYANRILANTSGASGDLRVCAYQDWRTAGTTAQRPEMSDIDAVTEYWDSDLNMPIWWDPNAGVWRDATGAPV